MGLWDTAKSKKDLLIFSTLFTAKSVRDYLSTDEGIDNTIKWCKDTAVTKVYIETFRDGYTVEKDILKNAKKRFQEEGFDVAGCVTTTRMKKISTHWKIIPCFTNKEVQEQLQQIFEYTASIFDLIMIDDFLFTDCECEECREAKGSRTWIEYRCDLMLKLSKERILEPAKAVNPNAKIIIKYPQWYDLFHVRGYDVDKETKAFDYIWAGTESREPDDKKWNAKMQYTSYYIMRWLGEIGGSKTGGGWFDSIDTGPLTYVEQARQTVLGDAGESFLFCYGGLQKRKGPEDIVKLRQEIPGLFKLAEIVRDKKIYGISAPKPCNSIPGKEEYIFDFIGMLGIPLVPTAEISPDVPTAFLSYHALKDPDLKEKINKMLDANKPLLITDGLAKELKDINLDLPNVIILEVKEDPYSILDIPLETLKKIRDLMLKPFNISLQVPIRTAFYLIGEEYIIFENFNNKSVEFNLKIKDLNTIETALIIPEEKQVTLNINNNEVSAVIPERTLLVLKKYKLKKS